MIIGVTGGVGSGKSAVMDILKTDFDMDVILADEVGHEVMDDISGEAYAHIIDHFGRGILDDKTLKIERSKLAGLVFNNKKELEVLNSIVHPAVKKEILSRIHKLKQVKGGNAFVAVEAALLLEDNYDAICDRVIYVYADEKVRRERLKSTRGYTDEKIDSIIRNQMSEEEFKRRTDDMVDNSNGLEDTRASLQKIVDKYKGL
ncbi:MAG: dephospho-CoA kinase [Lachnospiraceae bacterium]|nr:dephospho-CoA kinase [Lachnospiraceae bacterium]